MRGTRRIALAALGALALGAGLGACGGGDDDGGSTGASTGGGGGEPVTITFWDRQLFGDGGTSDRPREEWFSTQAIERFEEAHPDIKVKVVYTTGDLTAADNQFRAAGIAKNGPDVATLYAGGPTLAFANLLQPLTNDIGDLKDQLTGWESVTEDFQPDGEILGVPYGAGSYFYVFYNRALLREAGVEEDPKPASWQEFQALIKQLKDGGVDPIAIGDQEGYEGAWVFSALAGGQVGTEGFQAMRNHERDVDDPGVVEGWSAWNGLYESGLVNKDAAALKQDEAVARFQSGKVAMVIGGGWLNQQLYDELGDDVGSFPIPQLEGAPFAGSITGGPNVALVVTKYAKHKEQAIEFVKFMASAEIIDLYVKIKQTEASNHADADTSAITNPLLRQQADELKAGKTIYPFDNIMPGKVNDLLYRLDPQVLTGQESAADAAQQLEEANESAQ